MQYTKKIYICDRCKKEVETISHKTIGKIKKNIFGFDLVVNFDLCPDCLKDFENFMTEKEKESNESIFNR